MTSSEVRSRGAMLAALALVVWHGLAIAVAPYPQSDIKRMLAPLHESYLRVAYLDHPWSFFAPRPDAGRLVRYELIHADGTAEELPLSEMIDRAHPAYFRWIRLFDTVARGPSVLKESAAAYLCRRHGDLRPRGIRFVIVHQLTVSPELYSAGVRPGDPELVWGEILPELPCAAGGSTEATP